MKHLFCVLAVVSIGGAANAQNPAPPDRFVDVPEDHWAYQSVENLRKRGIIVGYPDRNLRGKRTVTRYEAATGLNRFVEVVEKAIPQKRTTNAPGATGPRGIAGPAGPAGSAGTRPKEVDLYRELLTRLSGEVALLREELKTVEKKAADSQLQIKR